MKDFQLMTDASGTSSEAFGKIVDTTSQQLAKNREQWASLKREVGRGLAPLVRDWLQGLDLLDDRWRSNAEEAQNYFDIIKLSMQHPSIRRHQLEILLGTKDAAKSIREVTAAFADMYAELSEYIPVANTCAGK